MVMVGWRSLVASKGIRTSSPRRSGGGARAAHRALLPAVRLQSQRFLGCIAIRPRCRPEQFDGSQECLQQSVTDGRMPNPPEIAWRWGGRAAADDHNAKGPSTFTMTIVQE